MKTAIVYYSKHHQNTKKVLDFLCQSQEITLIDAVKGADIDLSEYECIGFASGIYYSKFHKSVLRFAEEHLPEGKKVFFVYTCGVQKEGYTKSIAETAAKKSATVLGEYGCLGFNTFGPFKLIGGIAKGHPDQKELDAALAFFQSLA